MKSISYLTCTFVLLQITAFAFPCQNTKKQAAQETPALQGEPLAPCKPCYNPPAAFDVNSKCCKIRPSHINPFLDVSFIYWFAGEDGLTLASNGVFNSGTSYFATNTKTLGQSFDYSPGFKVGAGVVAYQEWTVGVEYTWFRGTTKTNSGAPLSGTSPTAGVSTATAAGGAQAWLVDDWFLQGTAAGQALAGSRVSSSWHLALDLLDVTAGRPFYQGSCVTISPFMGVRLALIRQSLNVHLTELTGLFTGMPPQPIESRNNSNSWALGPIFGGGTQWLLPMGFRLEGDAAFSLLYTKYTKIGHSEDVASTGFNLGPYTANENGSSSVRPTAELALGFGWGKYLYNQDYHIDFSADYDFLYFWSQNVMRKLVDDTLGGTSPAAGNLYLHGLTVTGRFDF